MGFAPVARAEQVARLIAQFDNCLLLGTAQFVVPHLEDSSVETTG